MSALPHVAAVPHSQFEALREGKEIIRQEAEALQSVSQQLDAEFSSAAELMFSCCGSVIVTGMGKAGIIGRKIAATLSSTGTRAHFLHPAEAIHGDLGMIHADDVVLVLSNSGETEEVNRLLPLLKRRRNRIIGVTAHHRSTLGEQSDVTITLGKLREAGQFGLAPTTSAVAMLAVGDALALVVSRRKGFTPTQFAMFHPGGSLGQQLKCVDEVMRTGAQLRLSRQEATIREVFAKLSQPGRRTGAVMLTDAEGRLSGLFTDSDLARLLENRRDDQLDRPIAEAMTTSPKTVRRGEPLSEAIAILSCHRVSEVPVVDEDRRPVGLIDITDVIGLLPAEAIE